MRSMQQKWINVFDKIVQEAGFEAIHQSKYANTGTLFVQKQGEFETLLSVVYDFQDTYCILQFYPRGEEPRKTCGFTPETCINHTHFKYNESEKVEASLQFVRDQMLLLSPPEKNLQE